MLKKNKKKYSVLVLMQTYNDGEYLIKAIKSLLGQTYKKLDILILEMFHFLQKKMNFLDLKLEVVKKEN